MRLAILGGGGFRTPFVYQALLHDRGEPRVRELRLYDVDHDRLAGMQRLLEELGSGYDAPLAVTATTDPDEAVRDVDFVFSAIRVGGTLGRRADEHVALARGVIGQETTGPGGLAYALRTIPVMVQWARRIGRLAPGAFVVNFTNPAGIITEAMQQVLGERVVGICDTPSSLGRRISGVLGAEESHVEFDYVGLNHLGWMRRVLVDGRDRLPALLADSAALEQLEESKIFGPEWLRMLGCVPNEYLYYYDHNREAIAALLAAPETRGDFLARTQATFFEQLCERPSSAVHLWREAVVEREASYMAEAKGGVQGHPATEYEPESDPARQGYAAEALAVMQAIGRDETTSLILNVRNNGTIPSLPADAVIEIPATVDGRGVHTLPLEQQPALWQLGLMQRIKAVERLIISAAVNGSRRDAVQAFALHPLVGSVALAKELVDAYCAAIPEVRAVLAASEPVTLGGRGAAAAG